MTKIGTTCGGAESFAHTDLLKEEMKMYGFPKRDYPNGARQHVRVEGLRLVPKRRYRVYDGYDGQSVEYFTSEDPGQSFGIPVYDSRANSLSRFRGAIKGVIAREALEEVINQPASVRVRQKYIGDYDFDGWENVYTGDSEFFLVLDEPRGEKPDGLLSAIQSDTRPYQLNGIATKPAWRGIHHIYLTDENHRAAVTAQENIEDLGVGHNQLVHLLSMQHRIANAGYDVEWGGAAHTIAVLWGARFLANGSIPDLDAIAHAQRTGQSRLIEARQKETVRQRYEQEYEPFASPFAAARATQHLVDDAAAPTAMELALRQVGYTDDQK